MKTSFRSIRSLRSSRLVKDTRGANMVEYIVLVGVVALLAMAGFKTFGGDLKTKITTQGTTVQGIQSE